MGQHHKLRIDLTGLEKLNVQSDREIIHFLLRKNRVFDLLLGLFRTIRHTPGSIIATPGLQRDLCRALQRDLQAMKAAVDFRFWGENPST